MTDETSVSHIPTVNIEEYNLLLADFQAFVSQMAPKYYYFTEQQMSDNPKEMSVVKKYVDASLFQITDPTEFNGEIIYKVYEKDDYFFDTQLPYGSLNKEIAIPGLLEDHTEGLLAIRDDDNFWVVAYFPYKYHVLAIQDVAKIIWPDEELTFLPDEFAEKTVENS